MAIIQAQAKLYQGFRCNVVDKNISAFLSSSFTVGNRNMPSPLLDGNGQYTIYPNILGSKILKMVADIVCQPQTSFTGRYKTYGGGNNVITTQGVDNTKNWKVVSELKCKFPTYFRLDIEALGIPEGTDCVIQMEEGFVIEADFPGSFKSPNPYNPSFTTFRTPKRFYQVQLTSQATVSSVVGFKRYAQAGLNPTFTMSPRITYNPGKFAALEMSYFVKTTNASKKVVSGSNATSVFTFQPLNKFRTRLYGSDFVTSPFTLTQPSNLARVRYSSANLYDYWFLQSSPYKYHGIIKNLDGFVMMAINATRIEMRYDYQSTFNVNANVGFRKRTTAALTSQSILQCDVLHKEGIVQQSNVVSTLVCSGDKPMRFTTLPSTTNVSLLLGAGAVNIKVEWGDGIIETYNAPGTITHTYSTSGTYDVRLTGSLESLGSGITPYGTGFRGISNLGEVGLKYISGMGRYGDILPTQLPASLEQMPYCFYNRAGYPTGSPGSLPTTNNYLTIIANWNTSNIKDISFCFTGILNNLSTPLCSSWNVSNVTNMESCFQNSQIVSDQYNNLSNWNTQSVTNMKNMWNGGINYFTIEDILNWNTSNVTTLEGCFRAQYNGIPTTGFNWDTSNVVSFKDCFRDIQDGISGAICNTWDVSAATDMSNMFYNTTIQYASTFNLKDWCVPQFATPLVSFGADRLPPPWGHCGGVRLPLPVITGGGPVNRDNTVKKFGSYSIQSGAGYLTVPPNLSYHTRVGYNNNGPFTWEGWFNLTAYNPSSGYRLLDDDSYFIIVVETDGELTIRHRWAPDDNVQFVSTGQTLNLNSWYHIAITNDGGTSKIFVNGQLTNTLSTGYSSTIRVPVFNAIRIGTNTAGSFFYIDDFRISKTVRYTTTFTPPTAAFTNDANTVLLLNAEVNLVDDPST
jgi:hypothetical protein